VCGLGLTAAMWWMYFDVVARVSEHKLATAEGVARAKLATDTYTYLHLPLIAGIVLTALGLKKSLLYVADTEHHTATEALHGLPLWALTCGTALYLAGLSALRRRNVGSWNLQRLVTAAILVAATPLLERAPAAVLVAVVALICAALVIFERTALRENRRKLLTPS
jgi:low temperature requirement protein LtrA